MGLKTQAEGPVQPLATAAKQGCGIYLKHADLAHNRRDDDPDAQPTAAHQGAHLWHHMFKLSAWSLTKRTTSLKHVSNADTSRSS